jgi:hypothetical protein
MKILSLRSSTIVTNVEKCTENITSSCTNLKTQHFYVILGASKCFGLPNNILNPGKCSEELA